MEQKRNIFDLNKEELQKLLVKTGEMPYRAGQIMKWVYSGVLNTDGMTDLPGKLRMGLNNTIVFGELTLEKRQVSLDGTVKYLFSLPNGEMVESVLMKYRHGYSACISTRV